MGSARILINFNANPWTVRNLQIAVNDAWHAIKQFARPRNQEVIEALLNEKIGEAGMNMGVDRSVERALRLVQRHERLSTFRNGSRLPRT